MSGILASYNRMLIKRPLSTKMLTSGAICSMGDLMCQYLEHSIIIIFTIYRVFT